MKQNPALILLLALVLLGITVPTSSAQKANTLEIEHSAAEIFARAVQLQKRGVVIGDRSSGSVMESKLYQMEVGIVRAIPCVISATSADVIMSDGTRLEHVGVVPDTLLLPTAQEMSMNHDPVLAYAASLVGVELDPKKAGELFPTKWKRK